MIQKAALSLVLWTGLLAGCAASLDGAWYSEDALRRTAATVRDEDAPAVILRKSQRVLSVGARNRTPYLQDETHRAVLVRKEAGRSEAEVRITLDAEANLVLLRARTLQPDGSVREVDARQLLTTEVKDGASGESAIVHILRIPGVAVGSIVEVVSLVEHAAWLQNRYFDISGRLPVLRYDAELTLPPAARFMAVAYNLPQPFKMTDHGDQVHLTLSAQDVRANPEGEPWSLPVTLRDPAWFVRVTAYAFQFSTMWTYQHWPALLQADAERLLADAAATVAVTPALNLRRCTDKACVIETALRRTHELLETTGWGTWDRQRPRARVIEARSGTASEKTLLLAAFLRQAGIDVQFALTSRYLSGRLDLDQPNRRWLNHLLLYLPAQPGMARPLWLDGACESCRDGDVPDWLRDATAIVLRPGKGDAPPDIALEKVTGRLVDANLETAQATVQLSEAGDVTVVVQEDTHGDPARQLRQTTRNWNGAGQRKAAEEWAQALDGRSTMLRYEAVSCDMDLGHCHRKTAMHIPGYATAHGTDWLVPLGVLGTRFQDLFATDKRVAPVGIPTTQRVHESMALILPLGYAVSQAPQSVSAHDGAFTIRCGASERDGRWTWTRELELPAGTYEVPRYAALRKVAQAWASCRTGTVVLNKVAAQGDLVPGAGSEGR